MKLPILTVTVQLEQDVVAARQRARQVAGLLGFEAQDQTRIATAVSEIARNAFAYAGGGRVEFVVEGATAPQLLVIRVSDSGRGIADVESILQGRYRSPTGMGVGITGARRLMDSFDLKPSPAGTTVWLRKLLPARAGLVTPETLRPLTQQLAAQSPHDPLSEVRQQNQELLRTLEELRSRQDELVLVNRELEDTNRGVVALYAELEERADHLRRADEVKTRFLANMTHEFRTPVNSILALAGLLQARTDGELTPEQERQVGYVRKSAEALSELVNDLLDLAKVEAGKIVVRPAEFDVAALFGALRGMLRPLLVGQSVSLVFDEPAGLPTLETDESKVSQILRNFISNALKFTERGEVRVSAVYDEPRDEVVFSVADTGIGIAPADLDRIFQEFGQLENPIQRRVKGTGLGLPLSKRLAELLGGSVGVTSQLGRGSVFSLRVPVRYRQRTPVAAEAPHIPDLSPDLIPVLAVEDRPEDRLIYERLLRGSPFQLVPAATLRQAREVIGRTRPRAILLDVMLGHQDTWKFLADLKADPATAGIPVIVATSIEDQPKAYSLGADAYGVKPIDRDWLLRELDRLILGRTVLIIDDDEAVRYTIRQLVRRSGWDTAEAASGPEGLAHLAASKAGAVFLDLIMPGMHGLEVLRALRERPDTASIPVFICSSAAISQDDLDQIRSLGAQVLPKAHLGPANVAAVLRGIEANRPPPGGGMPDSTG